MSKKPRPFFDKVYKILHMVPKGKVATYGQVALLLGMPRAARQVGWALHVLEEESGIPWQRVLNRKGMISTTCLEHDAPTQKELLEGENVEVFEKEGNYYASLEKYQWWPSERQLSSLKLPPEVMMKLEGLIPYSR